FPPSGPEHCGSTPHAGAGRKARPVPPGRGRLEAADRRRCSVVTEVLELADRLADLRVRTGRLTHELKAVNAEIENVDRRLAEAMTLEELQSFSRDGRLFYLKTETYVSPTAGARPRLIEWLKENGFGDIVQETVHHRTLSATVREMLDRSEEHTSEL